MGETCGGAEGVMRCRHGGAGRFAGCGSPWRSRCQAADATNVTHICSGAYGSPCGSCPRWRAGWCWAGRVSRRAWPQGFWQKWSSATGRRTVQAGR